MGSPVHLRRALTGSRAALPDDAAAAHPRRHRRHRRGADHVAARGLRRRAQLGLPVLLAARRRTDPRGVPRLRLRRARPSSGATGCCARSRATPRTCRSCTPSTAAATCPSASWTTWRATRVAAGAHRQRRGRPAADRRARRGDGRPGRRPATSGSEESEDSWALQRVLVDELADHWEQPDHGLWEIRGPRAALHALPGDGLGAFDRAVRAVEEHDLPGPGRALARGPRPGARGDPGAGLRRGAQHLHPALRDLRGGRGPAGAARRRVHRRRRSPDARHHRRDRGGPAARGLAAALPDRERRRRPRRATSTRSCACSFWLVTAYAQAGRARRRARADGPAARRSPTTSGCCPRSTTRRRPLRGELPAGLLTPHPGRRRDGARRPPRVYGSAPGDRRQRASADLSLAAHR